MITFLYIILFVAMVFILGYIALVIARINANLVYFIDWYMSQSTNELESYVPFSTCSRCGRPGGSYDPTCPECDIRLNLDGRS